MTRVPASPDLPAIRYLNVVREVYRLGRIGAAAEVVHMSQPAATQAVARIEERFGTALFDRHPKGMVPTRAGTLFRPRLLRLLEYLRRGDSQARRRLARADRRGAGKPFHGFCTPVQLRALLAIYRAGSFTQAAHDLGVKQPGLHRAARGLSALAGFELFEQTRGVVILTPAAEAFARQVRLAKSEFRQAIHEINELTGHDVTSFNIGSLPLSRAVILPAAIDALIREVDAAVQVNCLDARYDALLRDLRAGALDVLIGALRFPLPAADIVQEELFVDRLTVVTAPDHPLAGKPDVTLEDTLAFPWIAPPKSTPTGTYLFETLRLQDLSDTPVRAVSSCMVLMRLLLARGPCVSIASARQVETDNREGRLAMLPIALPDSDRPIGLTFRRDWAATPAQSRFLGIVRRVGRGSAP